MVTAVAPVGLRDRDAGTVTFTTSLGLGKKLERITSDPQVALAYHAREHGFSHSSSYILVQGLAEVTLRPDRDYSRTWSARRRSGSWVRPSAGGCSGTAGSRSTTPIAFPSP